MSHERVRESKCQKMRLNNFRDKTVRETGNEVTGTERLYCNHGQDNFFLKFTFSSDISFHFWQEI